MSESIRVFVALRHRVYTGSDGERRNFQVGDRLQAPDHVSTFEADLDLAQGWLEIARHGHRDRPFRRIVIRWNGAS